MSQVGVHSYSLPDAMQLGAEGEISFEVVYFYKWFKGQISQYEKRFDQSHENGWNT